MNEEEKTLELARLMGWVVEKRNEQDEYYMIAGEELRPYNNCNTGLSQFARILLKFPFFVDSFHTDIKQSMTGAFYKGWWHDLQPTQKTILDEILILNGIQI